MIESNKRHSIGQKYEILSKLGEGGFGIVYLVYSRETDNFYALKTFRDEYIADLKARDRFRKEAQTWVDLGLHQHLVRAEFVDEVGDRYYIAMEYVVPNERGMNSLASYLQHQPPDVTQTLRWSIQICYGMEYAYSKGIRCHRDIKPANIMVNRDGVVKITDFGLAGTLAKVADSSSARVNIRDGKVGFSFQTLDGLGFGTPTHMPPEQFNDAANCDEKSDVYAFGVVLFQMASRGSLPFFAPVPRADSRTENMRFWKAMYALHKNSLIPQLDSPVFPILQRCLEKEPVKRYPSFRELRLDLSSLLRSRTGEVVRPPEHEELEGWQLSNKGSSLDNLGRYEEAIICYDNALRINPQFVTAWSNKANSLLHLSRYDEAIDCCDKALAIDSSYTGAWINKANSLESSGRYEEAIKLCDKALELEPQNPHILFNKGNNFLKMGRYQEAVDCYDKALEIDPLYAKVWSNKGNCLACLGRHDEAISCQKRTIEIDPLNAIAWYDAGNSLQRLGRHEEAIKYFDKSLELGLQSAQVWFDKGTSLGSLNRCEEALELCSKAIEIEPVNAKMCELLPVVQTNFGFL